MKQRTLGASEIEASVVGFGAWAIGGLMWGGTEVDESVRAIQAGIDAGVNFIDTAPVYGLGVSEEIVGKAIQGRRDKVVLATKCGLISDEEKGDFFFNYNDTTPGGAGELKFYKYQGPDMIKREIEQSLTRLGVDCIDLYQTHWQDSTTPIAETMGALMELRTEGKIRAIGCSNATPAQMDEYRAAGQLDADQELYSMLDRKHEADNLPYCAENNVAFLAYSPLARGLLTGKVGPDRTFGEGDDRPQLPRFSVENREKVARLLEAFGAIAGDHGVTVSQLVIAWTIAQPGCSHVLVGARTPAQAIENAKAGEIELTESELQTIGVAIKTHASDIP